MRTTSFLTLAILGALGAGCGGSTPPAATPPAKAPAAAAPAATPAPAAHADASTPTAVPAGTTTVGATAAAAIPPAVREEADKLYNTRCVTCHGANGKGDGPAAVALNPRPRDYTLPEWQASVTDDQLAQIIVQGGAALGKSNLMPPNPDLSSKPDVVQALVAKVRSFRQ